MFIGPTFTAFAVFSYYVTFQSFFYSFFSFDFGNPPGRFVFLENYAAVVTQIEFWQSVWRTVQLFLLGTVFGFWVPIAQALIINELLRGKSVFRYLYVLPAAMPSVASMTVWLYIWNPEYGIANQIVGAFGLGPYKWLQDEGQVLFSLRIGGILGGGLGILIYLVSINNISPELYEAAKIDGASAFKRMYAITLPNIFNMIKLQFLLSLTSALLTFDDVLIMTNGGPGKSSTTVVMNIYKTAFSYMNFGGAMAMCVLLLFMTLIFVVLQLVLTRERAGGGGKAAV